MAIKRLDPKATFDYVCVYDEAIQHETSEELEASGAVQARFQDYLESFDINKLKFVEGKSPTLFRIRGLLSSEKAVIEEKYQEIDVVNKRIKYKNRQQMALDMFNLACIGIVNEDGTVEKVSADEVEYKVAQDVGAAIGLLGILSKNLKKA